MYRPLGGFKRESQDKLICYRPRDLSNNPREGIKNLEI